jgi:hypothetical protein
MNKTVLMAAVLAVATALAAGLTVTVLPASIQEAQANPCSNNLEDDDSSNNNRIGNVDDQECDLTGYFEFDEESESGDNVATETEATDIIPNPLFDPSDIDVIDEVN